MEQTLAERQSQEQCITQYHGQHDGTVNINGAHFLRHPSGGDRLIQEKGHISVCRDNFRGICAHGASCKYRHAVTGEHGAYESEYGVGNSQLHTGNTDNGSRISLANWSRSPCRRFRSGRCYRGASCPYLHPEYDKPISNMSEEQNIHRIVRVSGENRENNTRNITFSIDRRGRSPCRDFLRGNCIFGSNCRRLHPVNTFLRSRTEFVSQHHRDVTLRTSQGHDESSMLNSLRIGAFPRECRRRSPCRNFLSGKCYAGESCALLHPSPMYDRTRYNSWRAQRSDGVPAASGSPLFNNGAVGIMSKKFQNHEDQKILGIQPHWDMKVAYKENEARSTDDGMPLASNRENMNVTSWNWSSERQVSCNTWHSDGDELIRAPEVCLLSTKGKCNFGGSCKYLHGYHGYATSNRNTRPAGDGQRCERPEENFLGLCSSAEGHEDANLLSRPFKRQRSRSRSPLTPGNDIHCMNIRSYNSQMDLHQEGSYNIARFQFPDRRSYTFESPMYHTNGYQISTGAGTSINPGYRENYDSKSVGLQWHDEVVSQVSQIANASKKDKTDSVVSQEAFCSSMLEKEGNVKEINKKTADVMRSMESFSGKNIRKRGQESVPCEENIKGEANTSKQQDNGSIIENIKKNVEPVLEVSRRKLLVLDVNGLLADIVSKRHNNYKPDLIISKRRGVFKRPFCDDFLQFCFERFDVGIWSSRNEMNLTNAVNFLLKDTQKRLLFCWNQSHCTSTGYNTLEKKVKPLVLKELKNLWDNKEESLPWKKGYYNETNTILLDDSPYKALRNPPYTAVFPYPYTFNKVKDESLGPGGDIRVYLERLAEAENVQKFIQENPFGQRPITKDHSAWAFYAKIIDTLDEKLTSRKQGKDVNSDGILLEPKANIKWKPNRRKRRKW